MIQNNSMLVTLTICKWAAMKHDRSVSAQIETTHSAHNAGRYNKHLVDKSNLAEIERIAGEMRRYHYSRTYAWGNNGQRLLPSALFMEYRQELSDYKQKFQTAVAEFIDKYPDLVRLAAFRLGSMYDPLDYPDSSDLFAKFDVNLEITPVPDAEDFRVSVAQETQDEIRQQITASVNARVVDATRQCWERVRDVVARIAEQCGNEKGRLHDSMMNNARDLTDILKGLNFTDDPAIAAIEHDVRALIVPVESLRASPTLRRQAADAAEDLLKRIAPQAHV